MAEFSRLLLPAAVSLMVGACGGGGGSDAPASPSPGGVSSETNSARLVWIAPTQNEDASPLTDLAGYRVYYGTSPSNPTETVLIEDPNTTSYIVRGLSVGTYYFTVAAYNRNGAESNPSAQATYTVE